MRWLTILLVFIIVLAAGINVYVELTGETITGKPLQYIGLNISVLTPPTLFLIAPKNGTYFVNNSIPLDYSITGADTIWYKLDSGSNITITSPIVLSASEASHILYLFANNTIGEISANVTFAVNSSIFTIIYDKWKGSQKGSSTNFSILTYEEIQNLSNISLENTDYGKILFNQNINMTADENFSDNQLDINSTIEISSNYIFLNSTTLPNFNKKATLWLYGLSFSDSRILIDGDPCPSIICRKESYSGGVLKFNVTSFLGNFSAEETPAGLVTTIITAGGGGGGGIIGYLFPKPKTFSLDTEQIKISLTPGKVVTKKIIITNKLNKAISIDLENQNLDDFVLMKENKFTLIANESKEIYLDFIIRESALPDIYIGKLIFKDKGNNAEGEILVVIEVESEGALLDVNAEILEEYSKVPPNGKLITKITLFNLGAENNRNDITLDYIIKSETGQEILKERETVSIETQTSLVKRLTIPRNAIYGKYVLYVAATTTDGKIASASDTFDVVAPQVAKAYILIITLFMIIGAIVVYFTIIKRGKSEEVIRKLGMRDILANG